VSVANAQNRSGIEKRVPWTTSKVIGTPEPPPPYKTELAFPRLTNFDEPLDLMLAPGGKRFFVAERGGRIRSFLEQPDAQQADVVLELPQVTVAGFQPMKQPVYSLALHPRFAENGYLYVMRIPNPTAENQPQGSRVSRFTVHGEPPRADLASEKVIFEWPNGGHNGGCLRFGPDGYLYLVTGDGSGIADERVIGQDLSSVFAKLLRIDVDHPAPGKAYGIPVDNPFVNTPGALPETYAYGLRQLWRFSFDRASGDLWGGEVGQDLWEMIYRIQKGGNYGWSVQEGTHPFRPERKKGPTPILKPIVEHSHSDFRSITGGNVYHGARLPELSGSYVYGDFDTGRIWKIDVSTAQASELARTTYRIITWADGSTGELYFVDFTSGRIHRLVKNNVADLSDSFPRKLSETGLFASTKDHRVAPGVIPYSVNAPLWSDHALKDRYLAIPGNGQIGFDEITYPQPSPGATPGWRFPDGTVLVKTFSMEMERGKPQSAKRLETRLLHCQQFPGTQEYGDQYWHGYTYVWNDDQTDATLLEAGGADRLLRIKVGNELIEQNYRFPSRPECTLCHTNAAKFALGMSTIQMNRDHDYDGVVANQLATLEHIGLFTKPLPLRPEQLPRLPDYSDSRYTIDARARSYLHSNCAHCHIKWGGGNAEFKLLATLPLSELGVVNVAPNHGSFGIDGAKLLVIGDPQRSIIAHRIAKTGLGRMPHVGSRVVDESAVQLIDRWIQSLK